MQQNRYIITQFPQQRTMVDFWRMVWEQNVTTIIMLAPLNEMKMVHILLGFCYMYDVNKFYHSRDWMVNKLSIRTNLKVLIKYFGQDH